MDSCAFASLVPALGRTLCDGSNLVSFIFASPSVSSLKQLLPKSLLIGVGIVTPAGLSAEHSF